MILDWLYVVCAFCAGTCLSWVWFRRGSVASTNEVQSTQDVMLKDQAERTVLWEQLGHSMMPLVLILNAQMKSVIHQTEEAATDLGQNDQGQQRTGDAHGLHVLLGAGVARELGGAGEEEDRRQQDAAGEGGKGGGHGEPPVGAAGPGRDALGGTRRRDKRNSE